MTDFKLLLCTDMDRTIIPNGLQPESPGARKRFADFCQLPEVTLAYVTGRHLALVEKAIKNYSLPNPDFVISDVGTQIYQLKNKRWTNMPIWGEEIAKDWNGKNHAQLKQLFSHIRDLKIQEISKQNTYKLSYYLPLQVDQNAIIAEMQLLLEKENVKASLIWSIDEPKGLGLLDVLPQNATKLHAIDFLHEQLGFRLDEVIFAGDSGNDLPVLSSSIPSILVANATDDIKQTAIKQVIQNNCIDSLYIANSKALNMNGNYAAGVLEGVWHFAPELRNKLQPGSHS